MKEWLYLTAQREQENECFLNMVPTTPCRMKCFQHPAEVFPLYWVPPALVHILGEIPETAKHHLDVLTGNDVSNNQDAGDPVDTEEAVLPMKLERRTAVQQTWAFALQASSEPPYVLYTYRLKNEANCVPEQVVTPYLLHCCLEIDTSGSFLKDVGTQVYHKSTCWVQLKISVLS